MISLKFAFGASEHLYARLKCFALGCQNDTKFNKNLFSRDLSINTSKRSTMSLYFLTVCLNMSDMASCMKCLDESSQDFSYDCISIIKMISGRTHVFNFYTLWYTLNIRIDPRGTNHFFHKICNGEFTYLQKFNRYVESIQTNWKVLVWKAF